MKRRTFVTCLASTSLFARRATASTTFSRPENDMLAFRVMRHGSDIGEHRLTFAQNGTRLVVTTDATMHIGFGPITFYRYHHHATEIWDGDRFISLDSATDKNGTPVQVKARRTNEAVTIETARTAPLILPPNTIPFTHWNLAVTRSPLFNPQEGVAIHETVHILPASPIKLANGQDVSATRFDFTGTATISDWYDDQSVWTALRAVAPDGSILEYIRLG
jgi:hypothetical protein